MTTSYADYTLRGPSAAHINWLEGIARDLADDCQYAETKMERKKCYDDARDIMSDVFFDHLFPKTKKGVDDIKKKFDSEFKKVKKTMKKPKTK